MDIPIDMDWLQAVMLASVRLAAFLVLAPPFNNRAFPTMVKAMLSIGMGIAVSPVVTTDFPNMDAAAFLVALVEQIAIGAALGFLVYVIFSVLEGAGGLIDLFGGFQMAQQYDPMMNLNGAQFARFFQLTGIALMFSSGAYQIVLSGVARTFTALPLGASIPAGLTAQTVAEQASGMFIGALQIAGPLIIVLFLADLGLGLLSRVAPALNAFSLSYPIKIGLTLALGGMVFVALPAAVQTLTGTAQNVLAGSF